MRSWRCALKISTLLLLAFAFCMRISRGAESAPRMWIPEQPTPVYDVYRIDQPPMIDGVLDEPCWRNAPALELACDIHTHMEDRLPSAWCKLVWDERYLYAAFVCPVAWPIVTTGKKDDDKLFGGDAIELFVDSARDDRLAFEIHANPDNRFADVLLALKKKADGDYIVTPEWEWKLTGRKIAAKRSMSSSKSQGWVVELALPIGEKGLEWMLPTNKPKLPAEGITWGLYPVRVRPAQKEDPAGQAVRYLAPAPTFQQYNHVPSRWVKATFKNAKVPDRPATESDRLFPDRVLIEAAPEKEHDKQ